MKKLNSSLTGKGKTNHSNRFSLPRSAIVQSHRKNTRVSHQYSHKYSHQYSHQWRTELLGFLQQGGHIFRKEPFHTFCWLSCMFTMRLERIFALCWGRLSGLRDITKGPSYENSCAHRISDQFSTHSQEVVQSMNRRQDVIFRGNIVSFWDQ